MTVGELIKNFTTSQQVKIIGINEPIRATAQEIFELHRTTYILEAKVYTITAKNSIIEVGVLW